MREPACRDDRCCWGDPWHPRDPLLDGILHVSETENLRFSLAFAFVLVSNSRDLLRYVILKGLLFSDELPSKTAQLVQEVNRYHIIE